jgi:hypothetical protein
MGIGSQLSTAAEQAGKSGAVSAGRLKELVALAQKKRKLPPLSRQELTDVLRMAKRSEDVTDADTLIRLKKTPDVSDEVTVAPVVEPVADGGEVRPFSQVGKQLVSEADPSVIVRRLDDERFVYPDGIVVDVNGTVVGKTVADDLTDVGGDTEIDNLAASATDLSEEGAPRKGGKDNLTPKTKKVEATEELAKAIWLATTRADTEATSQKSLKQLLRKAQPFRTADGYSPDFLAAFPNAEAAAERLARLEDMAGVSNADRAAEQIDTAAQAVDVANTSRPPAGNRAATSADFQAAKELVGETLPEGDWIALTAAFNKLDDDQRQAVLAGVPLDTRRFLSAMLDPNQTAPSFLPNLVAARTRPFDVSGATATARPSAPRPDTSAADSLIDQPAAPTDVLARQLEDELKAALAEAKTATGTAALEAAKNRVRAAYADIVASSGTFANLQTRFDANLSAADNASAPSAEARFAARSVNEQQQAAAALRNALITQDEMVSAERARMLRAAVPQPQPAAITPGARTPEFAAEDIPDAEMPTAFDTATALRKEAQVGVEARAAGGGMPADARMAAMGLTDKTDTQRDLPLFLRGRDRNPPLESRAEFQDRAIDTRDKTAVEDALDLTSEIDSAQAEVDAAIAQSQTATGAGDLARARQRLTAAYAALDTKYRPRIVQEKTGRVQKLPEGMDKPPKGWVIERGRRALPDSLLSRGGPQQTYDDAISAMVGFGPRPQQNINRANTGLSADDMEGMNTEARRVYGTDVDELLDGDFDPDWDVSASGLDLEANGSMKPSRLGGQPQASRVEGAAQLAFGDVNPFGMTNEDGTPLFADASAVAEEVLAKGTRFKPGTANYEMARDRLAQVIDRKFAGVAKIDPKTVTAAKKQAKTTASSPVIDNLEASSTDLGPDSVVPVAKDAVAPVSGSPSADAVQPVSGRAKTVEEIQSEADDIEREVRKQAIDEGVSKTKADKMARAARKKHVTDQMAERKASGVQPVSGAEKPVVAADDPAPKPATAAPADEVKPVATPETPAAAADEVKPVTEPVDPVPSPTARPSDTPDAVGGKPKPESKFEATTTVTSSPSFLSRYKWPLLAGGLVVGGSIASKLGGGNAGGSGGDWKLPDGVGPPGEGGGGGGEFVPVPAGSNEDATLMDSAAAAAEAERLSRALERLRSQRAMNTGRASQTIMNYNGWR